MTVGSRVTLPDEGILRSVLSAQVKERLLEAILSGRYPPGSRIVETRVARELGTSQAPVREALRDLEALGVVEIEPFRGARVRRPSADELLEAFEIRAELESIGAREAAPWIEDDDLEALARDLAEIMAAARAGDARAQAASDARFHARIVDLSGNRTLGRVWRYLEPYSRTYITILSPGLDLVRSAELHVPVERALRGRDPVAASEAIHRHFAVAGEMLRLAWTSVAPRPD